MVVRGYGVRHAAVMEVILSKILIAACRDGMGLGEDDLSSRDANLGFSTIFSTALYRKKFDSLH